MKKLTLSLLLLFFASGVMGQVIGGIGQSQPIPPEQSCNTVVDTLYAINNTGSDYAWSPATGLNTTTGDTVVATITATTTYTVTYLNSSNQKDTGTTVITVTQLPPPNRPSFYRHGNDTLTSSAATGNQWYRNDTLLVGDTDQNLVITALGDYWVVVINGANGCSSPASDTLDVTSAINQLTVESGQLTVYPNPFSNELFIKINSQASGVGAWNLLVTDVLGRPVYSMPSLNYSNEIDLSNLASGMYFITVITKTGRAVVPVVKQN